MASHALIVRTESLLRHAQQAQGAAASLPRTEALYRQLEALRLQLAGHGLRVPIGGLQAEPEPEGPGFEAGSRSAGEEARSAKLPQDLGDRAVPAAEPPDLRRRPEPARQPLPEEPSPKTAPNPDRPDRPVRATVPSSPTDLERPEPAMEPETPRFGDGLPPSPEPSEERPAGPGARAVSPPPAAAVHRPQTARERAEPRFAEDRPPAAPSQEPDSRPARRAPWPVREDRRDARASRAAPPTLPTEAGGSSGEATDTTAARLSPATVRERRRQRAWLPVQVERPAGPGERPSPPSAAAPLAVEPEREPRPSGLRAASAAAAARRQPAPAGTPASAGEAPPEPPTRRPAAGEIRPPSLAAVEGSPTPALKGLRAAAPAERAGGPRVTAAVPPDTAGPEHGVPAALESDPRVRQLGLSSGPRRRPATSSLPDTGEALARQPPEGLPFPAASSPLPEASAIRPAAAADDDHLDRLAEQLERLLHAEARRHGIDL